MIKLVLFGFSIFYLLSNQRVKSQETNDVDNFNYTEIEGTKTDINFELSQKTHQNISVYQFNSNYPRQLVVQLSYLNLKPMPKQKIYELQIYIYEYSALIDCQNAFISQKYSPENLITILSLSHMIDHIKFNEQYFYLVYARINYFKQSNSDDSSELDAVNANLMFKFTENIFCQQKGKYDQTLGKCICEKNRFGPFCEYDIQIVTNYYPFEVSIKPFEGRYIQIYKISAEDELKLEMNIKHSQVPDIHMYRSDRSNEFPTQFKYFENLVFNSTNYSNVIQPNPNENSIILFIRNPSTSYIYVTLNIKNITLIDENNLILFILLSLLVTLVISFLCIFCFNKATSVSLIQIHFIIFKKILIKEQDKLAFLKGFSQKIFRLI